MSLLPKRTYRSGLAQGLQTGAFIVIIIAITKLIIGVAWIFVPEKGITTQKFFADLAPSLAEAGVAAVLICFSSSIAHVKPDDAAMRRLTGFLGAVLLGVALLFIRLAG